MRGCLFWEATSFMALAIALSSLPAHAQSDPSASVGQEPTPQSPQGGTNPSGPAQQGQDAGSDNIVKPPVFSPPEMEVRPIGSSTSLPSYDPLLRWGPVYVREVELLQSYDQITNVPGSNPGGIFNQGSFNSTILRTNIVYDRQLGQNRLTLQYAPRLTVVNGHVSGDYANQTTEFDWVQQLSPRWTLGLSNSFSYFAVRSLYGDYFLDVNAVTGTNVPTSILNAGGSWLNTNTQASFAYALSPTSSLSVAPFFGYGHVGGQINGPSTADIYQYGSKFAWTKQLSPSRGVTADYYYRMVGDLGNATVYNSGEIGVFQQLGASTVLAANVGVLSAGFASGTQWDFMGSVQASRSIGRSTVSIGYYRGFPLFSELNSQGVAQRVDGNVRLNLSQKWYWNVQGGYQDSLSSIIIDVSTKYVSTEMGYNLTPQISCFVSYAHQTQSATNPNLLAGTRDYILGGLRWTARPAN
jgi:hypothetical protein